MQVWCVAMPQSLQRTNTAGHDVGPSRLHVYAAPSLLRILQRGVFWTGPRGTRWLLPPGTDLLRVKVRNPRPPRTHVDPQVQRLLETLEEMSALSTRVLRRHFVASRQHLSSKPHPLPAKVRGDNAAASWDGYTFARRLQSSSSAVLIQRRRLSLQRPQKSSRLTPRSQLCIAFVVDGSAVGETGTADRVVEKRRREAEHKLHWHAFVENLRLAGKDGRSENQRRPRASQSGFFHEPIWIQITSFSFLERQRTRRRISSVGLHQSPAGRVRRFTQVAILTLSHFHALRAVLGWWWSTGRRRGVIRARPILGEFPATIHRARFIGLRLSALHLSRAAWPSAFHPRRHGLFEDQGGFE